MPARKKPNSSVVVGAIFLASGAAAVVADDWPEYGGDAGGTRYSGHTEITPANVDRLVPVWTFYSGDREHRTAGAVARSNVEATPILTGNRLVFCTAFNEVIALDPGDGRVLWRHDPGISLKSHPANGYTCRGVAAGVVAAATADAPCSHRIFTNTNDARLLALDARDGGRCEEFGTHGEVLIDPGMPLTWPGEFQVTSPPVVYDDLVIVGSSINDNGRVAAPHGTVRAFDARTGAPRWNWDPIPRSADDPVSREWGNGWREAGAANAWAPMTIDRVRGLVFVPTSSPSPDFFGGLRPGSNRYANSVVALNARTGALVWAYQIVHHDLWDYDVPAQPTLATIEWEGRQRDVVIQGTKQGFLFLLDRDTGLPLSPVEERPVPASDVPDEVASPTQPIPTQLPALAPQGLSPADAFGITPWDRGKCREAIAGARSEGLYTPPSLRGTILFPFTGGGINWGGIAVDSSQAIVYANTTRLVHLVRLVPRQNFEAFADAHPDDEVSPMKGAPYGMLRKILKSPLGLPCNPPPWGVLAAIDLGHRRILWQSAIGTLEEIAPLHLALHTGTPTFGGPLVTASGVVFIASTLDKYLRAFDARNGREIWQGHLPTPAQATPMTFEYQGRQIVLIAAGGHRDTGVPQGGTVVVAFALPKAGEPGPTLRSRTLDRPGGRFAVEATLLVLAIVGAWLAVKRLLARRR